MEKHTIKFKETSKEEELEFYSNIFLSDKRIEFEKIEQAKDFPLIQQIFYLPFVNTVLEKVPEKLQLILKILIGFLIVWSSLGVGELFDKIDLMKKSFPLPSYESVGSD